MSGGALAGIIVGSLVAFAAILAMIVIISLCWKHKKACFNVIEKKVEF